MQSWNVHTAAWIVYIVHSKLTLIDHSKPELSYVSSSNCHSNTLATNTHNIWHGTRQGGLQYDIEFFSDQPTRTTCIRVIITSTSNASYDEHNASYSREILLTIFGLFTTNDVSLSFKIKGNIRHNHIAIYDFRTIWFYSSFLVTNT